MLFNGSMKVSHALNAERQAAQVLEDFLARFPDFTITHLDRVGQSGKPDDGADLIVQGRFSGRPLRLAVQVKANGQPRAVQQAADDLRRYLSRHPGDAAPVVMAPYLSPQARDVCRREQVGYLDFMGNALIAFDTVYIEREVPGRPEAERRALRSLYKPKSARILRRLLREPGRSWRTAELADAAAVSTGLVSTVGTALRERGWAEQTEQGLVLTDPNALLDSWGEDYEPPKGQEVRRYTTLHGKALGEQLKRLVGAEGRVALASFTAADWLAPYARHPNSYFYADEAGLARLEDLLELSEATKGANVTIVVPEEEGVLDDAVRTADNLVVTSPVQTYLDLLQTGDRGREAADVLRQRLLEWPE